MSPKKPGDRPYLEHVHVMTEHHSHFQLPDEFVVTVPSRICISGPTLDDMVWDSVVSGINEAVIQHRLLAEPRLT